jgi:hypothetical protein
MGIDKNYELARKAFNWVKAKDMKHLEEYGIRLSARELHRAWLQHVKHAPNLSWVSTHRCDVAAGISGVSDYILRSSRDGDVPFRRAKDKIQYYVDSSMRKHVLNLDKTCGGETIEPLGVCEACDGV